MRTQKLYMVRQRKRQEKKLRRRIAGKASRKPISLLCQEFLSRQHHAAVEEGCGQILTEDQDFYSTHAISYAGLVVAIR